jgi:hypothetical protein
MQVGAFVGATASQIFSTTTFTDTGNPGWHHLALVRDSSTLRLFVDGVQEGTAAITGTVNDSTASLVVGNYATFAGASWTGWIDEFRLSVGVARWTADFTPRKERSATLTGFSHLAGKAAVVWADDTGAASANPWAPDAGKDLSPDVNGVQTTYTVDTGAGTIGLSEAVHHAVAGLPFTADWTYSKMAYAAEMTALCQVKRVPQLGLSLYHTHNRAITFGSDTGRMDPLPTMIEGAAVDANAIFETLDKTAMPVPSTWGTDTRLRIRARAPRPATVLALVPTVVTSEK